MRSRSRVHRSIVGVLVGALALAAGFAAVHAAQPVQRTDLVATSVTPGARGWTTLHAGHSKTTFVVVTRALPPRAPFDVVVNGVKVGSLTTNPAGNGKVRFRNVPHGHDVLLGFDPQGADVVVRDHDGHDCLSGHGGHPGDSASAACCLPDTHDDDGDGPCLPLPAAVCTAKGGTVPAASSCFPDPCPSSPANEVICCVPESARGAWLWHDEDGEVECRDVSSADCAAAGGTVVTATSCHPNPCAPTPPANLIACCVPEHDGDTDCKELTTERCTSLGGSAAGAFCDADPCGGGDDDDHDHGGGDDGDHGDHHGPWGGPPPGWGHGEHGGGRH